MQNQKTNKMHTINNNHTTFHFNGDFSGDIIITRQDSEYSGEIKVSMEALDALFAERIRQKRIEKLEQMTDEQLIANAIGL